MLFLIQNIGIEYFWHIEIILRRLKLINCLICKGIRENFSISGIALVVLFLQNIFE